MTAADDAYAAAERLIAEAKRTGAEGLSFDTEETRALARLPESIVGLDKLTKLGLDNTQISDLALLSGIRALQVLSLTNTPVNDITTLNSHYGLQILTLNGTQITELTLLGNQDMLRELSLNNTRVTDLAQIASLRRLERLSLTNTPVSDLAPLAGLTGLGALWLDNTRVADLTPLARLSNLGSLWLSNSMVSDLSPLTGLAMLYELLLINTPVRDLEPLVEVAGLRSLRLDGTQVADLRPLLRLRALLQPLSDHGLTFTDIPATRDSRIAEIAAIEDDKTRVVALFALLEAGWVPPEIRDAGNVPPGHTTVSRERDEPLPPFFFLSYASADRPQIAELRDFLTGQRVPLWWDQDIPAGATWRATIAEKLRATRSVVTFWTAESVKSNAVIEEVSTAQAAGRLVHVRLDDAPLPYGFGETQYVDLRKWDGTATHPQMAKLLQALLDKFSPPPQLPESRPAPLEPEIVNNRLVLESGSTGLPSSDANSRAEQGWHALKDYRESFGESFNIGNYAPLPSVLRSFDRALGEAYDPNRQIALGMHGQRIIGLANDADFVANLPTGAETELKGFAAAVATLVNRFPDWKRYQEEAEAAEPAAQKAAQERKSFAELDSVIEGSGNADAEVKAEYHDEVVAGTETGAGEAAAKGLVASTSEVARVLLEAGIAEVRSGKVARGFGKQMEDMHGKEFPKVLYYAGGFVLPMLSRMSKPLRRLAKRYPTRMGFVVAALDYLFGPDNGSQ